MDIELLKVSDIIPYDKNAKKHPDKQIEHIANSLQEFGFRQPLVISKNNVLVVGHGRLLAAKKLGLEYVPVARADDLTEEQIRAYRLVDNKTNESDWDFDFLDEEINDIFDLDMADFGFDVFDADIEHEKQAELTQDRVEDILNLNRESFESTGKYDIPVLSPVYELPAITRWIPFNYVLSDDEPEGKAVHFFVDDYQFERLFRNPEKYIEKLKRYVCVATPDFSPYSDMPNCCQIYNHYRKHWVGAYLQSRGLTVIPTIRASRDERSFEWYLDGEPENGIVIISSMWTNDQESLDYFKREYDMMYDKLNPCKVFLYGRDIKDLRGDIEHLETFTQEKWGK